MHYQTESTTPFAAALVVLNEAQVMDLLFRDYVESWYNDISDDPQFLTDLRRSFQTVIIGISSKYAYSSPSQRVLSLLKQMQGDELAQLFYGRAG